VLNEFINIARRKLGLSWANVRIAREANETLCVGPYPVDIELHRLGAELAEARPPSDGLVVSTAG
jgi:predicted nucleic acid-binding protein